MSVVGYARTSTAEQSPQAQEAELKAAGAEKIFTDRGESSRSAQRPAWQACLEYLRSGDVLVVRRLDRLAGSERMAIETINELGRRGVQIKSLTEPDIDTTTPMGRALFGIVAVFAQLRIDTIRENTLRGLAQARAQGRVLGRPSVVDDEKVKAMGVLREQGMSYAQIGRAVGVSEPTARRHTKKLRIFSVESP